ncbi:MAG: hypothetical protein J6Y06_01710 [Bacteroidales bacterium]|nr:hypothetical protein [Bacteroidales bacterium]
MDTGTATAEGRSIARVQGRVLAVLKSGERLTALQIAKRACVTDPRGHIAALRNKGIVIADAWIKSPEWGTRCKEYYLIELLSDE